MPLSMMEQGDTRKIKGFRGQEEMKVKGMKIALNRGLANGIIVTD